MNLRENKVSSTLEGLEEGKGENAVIIFSFQKLFQWLKKEITLQPMQYNHNPRFDNSPHSTITKKMKE